MRIGFTLLSVGVVPDMVGVHTALSECAGIPHNRWGRVSHPPFAANGTIVGGIGSIT